MNDERAQLAKGIISAPYIKQALEGTRSRSALLATLLSQRRLLPHGLDDFSIQMIMMELASMDSNNFLSNAGMGEREGRIFSAIVRARCWSMSHGVGRRCGARLDGDVCALRAGFVRV
jgi:O-phospho-L-seryl-tRNASec:L-selenocysteinyl-tRNA synthase